MCYLRSCIYERSCEGLSYHRTGSNRKIRFPGNSLSMGDYASLLLCSPTRSYTICERFVGKVLKTNQHELSEVSPASALPSGQPLTSLNSEFSLGSKVGSLLDVMLILECYEKILKRLSWTTWLLRIHLPCVHRRPYPQSWLGSALGSGSTRKMRSWQSVEGFFWDTMRFEKWVGEVWSQLN